jgi:hypothetical protein
LSQHATSSLPFFDDNDTYNYGYGRNRNHLPGLADIKIQSTTNISSAAILDFDFDPTDLK